MHPLTQGILSGTSGVSVTLCRYKEHEHFDAYLELVLHPETRCFLDPVHCGVLEELEFVRRSARDPQTMIYMVIRPLENDSKPIGTVMLTSIDTRSRRAKISRLIVAPDYRHRSVAREALHVLTRFAFRHLRLHQIYCYVLETNVHGRQLFSKLGFVEYGYRPEWTRVGTYWIGEHEMHLTVKRFHELHGSGA